MDYEDPENKSCLREESVYCDTMHSRVQNYKNITAWVKKPIMRAVMRIATMEAMNEDTPTMTLFFNFLNEVLQKVNGQPNYKFNPSHFYIDEAGANKNAIGRVFGRSALDRTVTCQWHFMQCARAKAMYVKESHRKTFLVPLYCLILVPLLIWEQNFKQYTCILELLVIFEVMKI